MLLPSPSRASKPIDVRDHFSTPLTYKKSIDEGSTRCCVCSESPDHAMSRRRSVMLCNMRRGINVSRSHCKIHSREEGNAGGKRRYVWLGIGGDLDAKRTGDLQLKSHFFDAEMDTIKWQSPDAPCLLSPLSLPSPQPTNVTRE